MGASNLSAHSITGAVYDTAAFRCWALQFKLAFKAFHRCAAEGAAFDGTVFNRTAITAPFFKYLAPSESADEKMVSRGGIEPPTRRLRVCCSAN